ncbi:hypothetical protein AB0O34_07565 [Sphaerisporangium sp. NPDC088356]|uniref:hypothetical protein n=1 Tax=Sphaerisporangium sp. NPDC088356 TaxID=3154871 RepID=UPI003415013A
MSKITAMTAINQSLQNTALSSARVWNPFHTLAEGPTNVFSANPGWSPMVPEVIPDAKTFANAGRGEKITYSGLAKQAGLLDKDLEWTDLTSPVFERLRGKLKIDYLKRGAESIKNFPSGVCTMFACAVLGHLAVNNNLLDNGSVVELFKYEGDQGGHAFIVVNRMGAANDVDSWGAECYTIDPWYARHRINAPGSNPVKDMTAGTNFSDPLFNTFLKDANSRTAMVTFTHLELIQALT